MTRFNFSYLSVSDKLIVLCIFRHIDVANASFSFEVEDADRLTQFEIW